jgi:beta-phosphoglucomutase-like phosphatase (HAD superfamily)
MGVPPSACVVIEDSPAGVEAAKRAGMRVFGFTGGSHAERGALREALAPLEPEIMFDDMLQLPSLLAGLEARKKAR